jgi:hypothetical protein
MKGSLSDLESSLQGGAKTVEKELISSALSDANGPDPPVDSALDQWLRSVGTWVPRQRSIAREIEILRILEESHGAIMLKALHDRMIVLGLSEKGGQAAVVTQISRMGKKGTVTRQAQGLYSRTDGGLNRLQKMRLNYRDLLVPDDVRKSL